MTAAELNAYSADLTEATARVEGMTAQTKLRGLVFDYDAPLPDLNIRQARSWEPAARRFRDLTEEERREHE